MRGLAINLLLTQLSAYLAEVAFSVMSPVNGALWSIPYEFWCYLGRRWLLGLLEADQRQFCLLLPAASLPG